MMLTLLQHLKVRIRNSEDTYSIVTNRELMNASWAFPLSDKQS